MSRPTGWGRNAEPVQRATVNGRAVSLVGRDRTVDFRTVTCPTCHADIGADCVSLATGEPTGRHPSRRRMAVRLLNAELA